MQFSRAINDFHDARRKAMMENLMGYFRRQPTDLLSYDEVRRKLRMYESPRRTLEEIPLDQIVGSVNRYTDFTRSFLPRQESDVQRWARVKLGWEGMTGLPPIDAYKVGDVYFVLDGHHRVSVAREMGAKTIEGYVTPVYTRVPLSPNDRPDDLILKSEYDDFLNKTRLDDLRPDANLLVTAPGQYEKLLEHIAVHRYFMGEKRHQEVSYSDAVVDWYDHVYRPIADLIRERNLLRDFPGRSETDLYLWIMDHAVALSGGQLGWEVPPERAAEDLVENYSPVPSRRLPRIAHRLLNLVTPDTFVSGPPPGSWRAEHQSPRRGNRLFDDILVAVPQEGGKSEWPAVRMAVEVARREEARLTGLHVVGKNDPEDTPEIEELKEDFSRRCSEAGIVGRLQVDRGQAARLLCERSPWVDLIVFRLNYPPPARLLKRLRSGIRLLIRGCSSPLLAVPDAPFNLDSALLAYGPGRKSDEALFVATYLAGRWGISLTVLTVNRAGGSEGDAKSGSADGQAGESAAQPGLLLERARQYLETHGVQNVRYMEESGDGGRDAARAVLLAAEEQGAGFLIMGGYEANPLRESITGSTVDRVLRSTRRPVLICR